MRERRARSKLSGFLKETKLVFKSALRRKRPEVDQYANENLCWAHIPHELLINISELVESDCAFKTIRLVCRHWNSCVNYSITSLAPKPLKSTTSASMVKALPTRFPSLTFLDLNRLGNSVNDEALRWLVDIPKLKRLRVGSGNCHSLNFVPNLVDLSVLSLAGCYALDSDTIKNLEGHTAVGVLDLFDCPNVGDEELGGIGAMVNLSELILSRCTAITDVGIAILSTSCSAASLTYLDLTGCDIITDQALISISAMSRLEFLSVAGCYQISNDGLKNLVELTSMRRLDISECPGVTDAGLKHLASALDLVDLNLSGCDEVGDEGMSEITNLRHLKGLDLSFCGKITDEGLMLLVTLAELTHLNLLGCVGVTPGVLPALSNGLRLATLGLP
ncbi:hypothetical protein BSKO_07358 [Bryopsis sp. KO-2023]|nr:hypothetical protein BSKO_07358 [Bryopsis sp. KO-2023]